MNPSSALPDTTAPSFSQKSLLVIAMVFPTVAAAIYFLALGSSRTAPWAFSLAKIAQFSLPLLALELWRPFRLWPPFGPPFRTERGPSSDWSPGRSLLAGVATGLAAAMVIGAAYRAVSGSAVAAGLGREIATKTADFGIDTPGSYLAMALFLSLAHSLLEEYYWRGFVFGAVRRWTNRRRALWLSSLAFVAHHVLIVGRFADSGQGLATTTTLIALGSIAVFAGGLLWAWLYARSGSMLASWISHAIADLAILAVGYDLIWG